MRAISAAAFLLICAASLCAAASPCPYQGRTADDALLQASDALIDEYYNPATGLFNTTGWWNSASVLYGLAVGARLRPTLNASRVLELLLHTFNANEGRFLNGDFGGEVWWGLCWVAASDLAFHLNRPSLGDAFLAAALELSRDIGTRGLNGCIEVNTGELTELLPTEAYAALAGQLVLRTGGRGEARNARYGAETILNARFLTLQAWFNETRCFDTFGPRWTCNQGVILGVLSDRELILGELQLLLQAVELARQSMTDFSVKGILSEACEPNCDGNATQYKGLYIRGLLSLWISLERWRKSAGDDHPSMRFVNDTLALLKDFVRRNARSALQNDCAVLPIAPQTSGNRTEGWFFGLQWQGPFDKADAARQSSAFELLLAAAVMEAA